MKKITEKRLLPKEELRNLCIENWWYTQGTNEDYENLFDYDAENMTTENIVRLAENIKEHSNIEDIPESRTYICYLIASRCKALFSYIE